MPFQQSPLRAARFTDEQHFNGHLPDESADETWQETSFVVWFDPLTRAGGYHHVALCPLDGRAEVWSALVLDGHEIAQYQSFSLPLPGTPYEDMQVGPLHMTSKDLRRHSATADYGQAGCDVSYESFTDPVCFNADMDGLRLATHHFESLGRVTGTFRHDGRVFDVNGFGFHDHSWGNRDVGNLLSYRWLFAVFDSDTFCNMYKLVTPEAAMYIPSYFHENGEYRPIVAGELGFQMADDGHSPTGCETSLWTAEHGGYHLRGRVQATSVHSGPSGTTPSAVGHGEFMCTVGFTTFEMGGRLGVGLLENRELAAPAPWHRQHLGLESVAAGPVAL